MSIIETRREKMRVSEEIRTVRKELSYNLEVLEKQLVELKEKEKLFAAGINVDYVGVAKNILLIRGEYKPTSKQRVDVVRNAINDLSAECSQLKKKYYGVKNYSGFGDQGCDCEYGMGPRHGSIVFSVGLKEKNPTEEQIEASIYYLMNIEEIQRKAKEAA